MRRFGSETYRKMPWANNRGTTEEIARDDTGGRLLWRLSLAGVTEDGPFSPLPGISRILTVVEGHGLSLTGGGLELTARPFAPIDFPGAPPLDARLIDGPVRDLNLMFDPTRIVATARCVTGPERIVADRATILIWLAPGSAAIGELAAGDTGLAAEGETVDLAPGVRAVVMTLFEAS